MKEQKLQKVHCQVITSVGECNETLTIDGSVDDVIKILESTRINNKDNNIQIHVSPSGVKIVTIDFVEELKGNLEKGFEEWSKIQ